MDEIYEPNERKYDFVASKNKLSACCMDRIIYGGGLGEPFKRICNKCGTVLSTFIESEDELEKLLINY